MNSHKARQSASILFRLFCEVDCKTPAIQQRYVNKRDHDIDLRVNYDFKVRRILCVTIPRINDVRLAIWGAYIIQFWTARNSNHHFNGTVGCLYIKVMIRGLMLIDCAIVADFESSVRCPWPSYCIRGRGERAY